MLLQLLWHLNFSMINMSIPWNDVWQTFLLLRYWPLSSNTVCTSCTSKCPFGMVFTSEWWLQCLQTCACCHCVHNYYTRFSFSVILASTTMIQSYLSFAGIERSCILYYSDWYGTGLTYCLARSYICTTCKIPVMLNVTTGVWSPNSSTNLFM